MIAIGTYAFPPRATVADVETVEIDGRVRKRVRIRSLLDGFSSFALLQAQVALLEQQVEAFHNGTAQLLLHPGRSYAGRRRALTKFVDERARIAAVRVEIETEDQFERATTPTEYVTFISQNGEGQQATNAGNAPARPTIRILAAGRLVHPTISDGVRALTYGAVLESGHILDLDSDAQTAVVDLSTNVLGDCGGEFPLLLPGENIITFTADPSGDAVCDLYVKYRDTWY